MQYGFDSFNPIIGLILTLLSNESFTNFSEFQSHYRSDFNEFDYPNEVITIQFQSHYRSDFNLII